MATFPTFEDTYRPKLQSALTKHVDLMERTVNEAQQTNDADAAEGLLDEACKQCLNQFQAQMDEIRASVKQKGTSCITPEERQRYASFVGGVAAGIRKTQGLFDQIFQRIRDIVKTVTDWIRAGCAWMANAVSQAFNGIRSLLP